MTRNSTCTNEAKKRRTQHANMDVRQKLVLQTVCAMICSEKIYTLYNFILKKNTQNINIVDIGNIQLTFLFPKSILVKPMITNRDILPKSISNYIFMSTHTYV